MIGIIKPEVNIYKHLYFNTFVENYRLMKKWRKLVDSFKGHVVEVVEKFLEEQARIREAELAEAQSIDTQTLKQNDFLMRHFIRKRRKSSPAQRYTLSYQTTNVIYL